MLYHFICMRERPCRLSQTENMPFFKYLENAINTVGDIGQQMEFIISN